MNGHASSSLTVVIVGAGLGGLAAAISIQLAGHHAIVLEAAPKLGEIGAGIQLTPNVTRLLDRWGLGEEIARTAVHPETIWFKRWQDGKKIAKTTLVPDFEQNFGARYYVAHRAHLHDALHRKALELGAGASLSPSPCCGLL
jgi:salicylate hydroxylase